MPPFPIPMWFYAVAAAVLLVIGAAGGAHVQGDVDDARAEKLVAAADKAARIESARIAGIGASTDHTAAAAIVENAQKNQALLQEVPRVVEKNTTRAGFVDAVRLLNNAGASGLPVSEAAGPVDDSPAAAEAVASTIAENIGQCRADLERFGQLQAWLEQVSGP